MRTKSDRRVFWAMVVAVVVGPVARTAHAQQQPPTVISLTFGNGWGEPAAWTVDEDAFWDTDENHTTLPGQVAVPKFNPAWGTLQSAVFTIQSIQAEYLWDISLDFADLLFEDAFFNPPPPFVSVGGWSFGAVASISWETGGLEEVGFGGGSASEPDLSGAISLGFDEIMTSVPLSEAIGPGSFIITLHQELSAEGYIDADGNGVVDSFDDNDIDVSGLIHGVFSGIVTMTYNFTPSATVPPPGDATLNNVVDRADFDALMSNFWRSDAATGWNHGDFDQDGDVDLADYVSLQDNFLVGDMNGDGLLDSFDVSPFELALSDIEAYNTQYPGLIGELLGDANSDASFDAFDISAFEALISGGGATAALPEPASFSLLASGGIAMIRIRAARG